MRIATFNLLNGRSPNDETVDPDRFSRAIAALDPDLLALQEVDRDQPRSGGADLTALAAGAMEAVDHRFAAALTGTPDDWAGASGDEPDGTPAYGIALLSRYPVTAWHVVRLPAAPVRVPYRSPGQRRLEWVRDEPRVALVADVKLPADTCATSPRISPTCRCRAVASCADSCTAWDAIRVTTPGRPCWPAT